MTNQAGLWFKSFVVYIAKDVKRCYFPVGLPQVLIGPDIVIPFVLI